MLWSKVLELCLCSRHNISPGNPEGADQPKTMEMISICWSRFGWFFGITAVLTWRERRWSRCHWWWRTQWGDPWCLQWGSPGPPPWSSCPSQCCQRSPCQSRSAPAGGWRKVVDLLSFKIRNEIFKIETYWNLWNMMLHWIWNAAHCYSWTFHTRKWVFWVSSNLFLWRLLWLHLHPPPCLFPIFHQPFGHQHRFLHSWHCSWRWTWSVFRCSLFLLDYILVLPEKETEQFSP